MRSWHPLAKFAVLFLVTIAVIIAFRVVYLGEPLDSPWFPWRW